MPRAISSFLHFGTLIQNNMQIMANWSISKPEVEFQHVGRLYFETGSSYISAANCAILTKFGILIDIDLLKVAAAILITGYDVIFPQRELRYGRNSVA